jgi:ATP-dependent Clp protease ATP-binding subunit ClpC
MAWLQRSGLRRGDAGGREARLLRHRYLGTEHLLLALACDEGLAGSALKRVGASPEGVSGQIHRIIGRGHSSGAATLGITPRTKRVFEAARREARRLGHRCADTEHLLLAVCESDGVAQQMLQEAGAEAGAVRTQLAMLLGERSPGARGRVAHPGAPAAAWLAAMIGLSSATLP